MTVLLAAVGLALVLLAAILFAPNSYRRSLAILALLTAAMGALPLLLASPHPREINLLIFLGLLAMFWIAGRFEAK